MSSAYSYSSIFNNNANVSHSLKINCELILGVVFVLFCSLVVVLYSIGKQTLVMPILANKAIFNSGSHTSNFCSFNILIKFKSLQTHVLLSFYKWYSIWNCKSHSLLIHCFAMNKFNKSFKMKSVKKVCVYQISEIKLFCTLYVQNL
jgi:hypothetical protein